jgi:hypothetical protein
MHCINLPTLHKLTFTLKSQKTLIYRHVKDLVAPCTTVGKWVSRYLVHGKNGQGGALIMRAAKGCEGHMTVGCVTTDYLFCARFYYED